MLKAGEQIARFANHWYDRSVPAKEETHHLEMAEFVPGQGVPHLCIYHCRRLAYLYGQMLLEQDNILIY
jgi:hypothetical protein